MAEIGVSSVLLVGCEIEGVAGYCEDKLNCPAASLESVEDLIRTIKVVSWF